MSDKTSGAAEAAPGQLASVLLEAALAKKRSTPAPASSGLGDIDSAVLQGGFRYGEITSIAGVSGIGKTLVGPLFSLIAEFAPIGLVMSQMITVLV